MFVDASAIVAILTCEPDADALADLPESARAPITSAIAVFESALGLCRKRHASVEEARSDVEDFRRTAGVELVAITGAEAATALDAFARYGKGRGHPARLNMGDCFAYAVAKARRTSCCSRATISARPTSEQRARPRSRWAACRSCGRHRAARLGGRVASLLAMTVAF